MKMLIYRHLWFLVTPENVRVLLSVLGTGELNIDISCICRCVHGFLFRMALDFLSIPFISGSLYLFILHYLLTQLVLT